MGVNKQKVMPNPARNSYTAKGDSFAAGKPPTHLTFLLNFFDGLQRKVTAGK